MRSNHMLGIGISCVLASFGVGTAPAADCLVATTDGASKAFARGQLDAAAQRIFDEETLWGLNPLEQAAGGNFTGQPGVLEYKFGEEIYQTIPFSLLNRQAVIRITFGSSDPAKPLATADRAKPLATADRAKPLATADRAKPLATVDPAKPLATAERFSVPFSNIPGITSPMPTVRPVTFVPVPGGIHMGGGVPAKEPLNSYVNRFFQRGGHGPGYSGGERNFLNQLLAFSPLYTITVKARPSC